MTHEYVLLKALFDVVTSALMVYVLVRLIITNNRMSKFIKSVTPKPPAWIELRKPMADANGCGFDWIDSPLAVGLYDIKYGEDGVAILAFWDGAKFLSPTRRAMIGEQPTHWRHVHGAGV